MYRQTDRQTDGRTDGQAGRQAGRQADRQTDRQTGRQAGRQAEHGQRGRKDLHLYLRAKGHSSMPVSGSGRIPFARHAPPGVSGQVQGPHISQGLCRAHATAKDDQGVA